MVSVEPGRLEVGDSREAAQQAIVVDRPARVRLLVDRGLTENCYARRALATLLSRATAIEGSSARPDQRRTTLAPDCVPSKAKNITAV